MELYSKQMIRREACWPGKAFLNGSIYDRCWREVRTATRYWKYHLLRSLRYPLRKHNVAVSMADTGERFEQQLAIGNTICWRGPYSSLRKPLALVGQDKSKIFKDSEGMMIFDPGWLSDPGYDAKMFQVFVRTVTGRTITVSCRPSTAIIAIKDFILHREGVPVLQQRLSFAGKQMMNGGNLYDYNVHRDSTIDWRSGFLAEWAIMGEVVAIKGQGMRVVTRRMRMGKVVRKVERLRKHLVRKRQHLQDSKNMMG